MTVICLLCLVYTFHISFRWLITLDAVTCSDFVPRKSKANIVARSLGSEDRSLSRANETENSVLLRLTRTNYFGCENFDHLPKTVKSREENKKGNRAISFIKIKIDGIVIPAVYKEANKYVRFYYVQTYCDVA